MTRFPYLVRRGVTFHFRRVIPPRFRSALLCREIVRSLHTCDARLAIIRARTLYDAIDDCFLRLRAMDMLSRREITEIVEDFKTRMLAMEELLRVAAPISEMERQVVLDLHRRDLVSAKEEAARGDHHRVESALALITSIRGKTLNALQERQLGQALMLAAVDFISVSQARFSGDFSDQYLAHGYDRVLREGQGAPQSFRDAGEAQLTARVDTSAPTKTTPALSIAVREFLAHQRAGKIWDEQTLRQAEKTFELMIEILSDRALEDYRRPEANRMKAVLQDLPADYGKAALFRGRPALEILEIDKKRLPVGERLSSRTVKRHLSVVSALWKWQAREGLELSNPFVGFSFPSTKRANEQRDMWETEALQALFRSPVWTGCKSAGRRSEAGTLIIRDEKFWLPLIGLFSGMRQEEMCQLQIDDIRKIDGQWVFDINAKPPRKLKNKNAVRRVPVHPVLQKIGFLEHVDGQRTRGSTALFPELAPGGADSRLGHGFSKWFARYRQQIGIYRKGLDFHSLRHTATTLLHRGGVTGPVIDELTGHATAGETARYSHGSSMSQLVAAIAAIRPELDLSHLSGKPS